MERFSPMERSKRVILNTRTIAEILVPCEKNKYIFFEKVKFLKLFLQSSSHTHTDIYLYNLILQKLLRNSLKIYYKYLKILILNHKFILLSLVTKRKSHL